MSGQRYTPVAGFEGERQRYSAHGSADYGRGDHNELNTFYDGNVPAAHRLTSTSIPSMQSQQVHEAEPGQFSRMDSGWSEKDVAPAVGAGAGAGAVAGVGAGTSRYTNPYNSASANQANSYAYQNVPSEQYWSDANNVSRPFDAPKSNKKKWWIIGGVVGAVVIIAAVVGGVVGSMQARKSSGGSNSSGSGSSGGNVNLGSDPSVFEKDSRLHNSFWGFAYTPQGSVPPACGATQANVTRDIQLLSQITTRLRLYSANCNITDLVLQAIQDTKVNMTIWPAVYINEDTSINDAQMKTIEASIQKYGTKHIEGVTVGNEFLLNNATSASITSQVYLNAVDWLSTYIQDMNSTLLSMNLDKHLPVGISDAGSLMSAYLGRRIDYFMANVHPWFGHLAIQDAAQWTWQFFQWNDVEIAAEAPNNPATFIAETGWPTASMNASEANSGAGGAAGEASVANLQTFLDTFVCQANANGTHYFYFEAFDEPWKSIYGGVEPYWGLFDKDRNLKNVTIPQC